MAISSIAIAFLLAQSPVNTVRGEELSVASKAKLKEWSNGRVQKSLIGDPHSPFFHKVYITTFHKYEYLVVVDHVGSGVVGSKIHVLTATKPYPGFVSSFECYGIVDVRAEHNPDELNIYDADSHDLRCSIKIR